MQTQTLAPPRQRVKTGPVARYQLDTIRTFTCQSCGDRWDEENASGRKPANCPACDPRAAERRAYHRALTKRKRAEVDALACRVAVLEVELAQERDGSGDFERATSCGEPGRDSLARAVRRLAHATGVADTSEALLTISAVARAWAARLGAVADA